MNRLALSILLLTLFAVTAGRRIVIATEPSGQRNLFEVTQVSSEFRQQVQLASRSIPDSVWQQVERAGWRVRMAEFVIDAAPSLKNSRPRGWPANSTWNNSDALHLPRAKLLVLAEKRRSYSGRIVSSNRVSGVLRHEFGHAYDFAVGDHGSVHSATSGFVARYRQDVAGLDENQRKQLQYYLQNERAGRQEAFAEAFAIQLGGGSDTTRQADFASSFPRVMQHVKQVIERHGANLR